MEFIVSYLHSWCHPSLKTSWCDSYIYHKPLNSATYVHQLSYRMVPQSDMGVMFTNLANELGYQLS